MELKTSILTFTLFITERLYGFVKMEPYWLDGLTVRRKVLATDPISPTQKSIVELCAECEDSILLKKFSSGEVTIMNLLNKLEKNKKAGALFWKYLGRRYQKVIELAGSAPDIKFYFRKPNTNVVFDHDAISVCRQMVHPHHSFRLTKEGLAYSFHFSNNEDTIRMLNENSLTVITPSEPCIFILNNMLCTTNTISSKAIGAMAKKGHIVVPTSTVQLYMETYVSKLLQTDEIECKGFSVNHIKPSIHPKLTATTDAFGKEALRLDFDYDGDIIPFHSAQKHKVEVSNNDGDYAFTVTKRDFARETQLLELLEELGAKANGEYLYTSHREATTALLDNDEIKQQFTTNREFELTTHADEQEDWFDVKIVLQVRGFSIPFSKLRRNIQQQNPTYTLPDGSTFRLPAEWFSQYADLAEKADFDGDSVRLNKRYAGLIADQFPAADRYLQRLSANDEAAPLKVNATLRNYQQQGYNYLLNLYRHNYGGCLADDMGLGKTLQFIAFFCKIYEGGSRVRTASVRTSQPWRYSSSEPSLFDQELTKDSTPQLEEPTEARKPASLVVMPTTVLFNWQKELQRFAPHLHYTVHYGAKRTTNITAKTFDAYHLVLTTYNILQRDAEKLANYGFECAVLDESQNIKNPQSLVHTAARRLQAHCHYVVTGTPIENSLSDLWAQFSFACPGLLGSYKSFSEHYTASNPERLQNLKKMVSTYILRRTKKEVCPDLPALTKTDVWCEMGEKEKKAYEAEKSAARNAILHIPGARTNALHVLQQLMRLRQLACDPAILPEYNKIESSKRQAILAHASELHHSGNKVLLFSAFVKQLNLIASDFEREGISHLTLTGEDTSASRQEKIERFQNDPSITSLLISLKAGSTGINLTAANYVFLVSPWWNPFIEQQAIDRAYRIGQQQNVMVYNFITKDTVEEKILHLQERKRKLSDAIIDTENPLQHLSAAELEQLV